MFAGCVGENLNDCALETEVFITVLPDEYRGKFTPAEGATVFLFDQHRRFLTQVAVSKEQIEYRLPVRLPLPPSARPWAAVWGNLGDREQILNLAEGASPEEVIVRVRRDAEGNRMSPDDLFYSMKQLSGVPSEEIVISPKTARINIRVKGLPAQADANDYYFTTQTHYDGYDFAGTPQAGTTGSKFPGILDEKHDLITPRPYNLIHYPAEGTMQGKGEQAVVGLWKKSGSGAGNLLASVTHDTNGRPLAPQAGKTTNILIHFRSTGEISIELVITGWNEVYQWDEW